MTALAIDTSLDACAAALHGDGARLERREIMARGHAERLPVMVRDIMAEAGLRFDQLARVAVTIGPGTFTGIRIGLAFARGLGLVLGIPVIGFNTLEAIALGIEERPLLVANTARDDEVYAAYYPDPVSSRPSMSEANARAGTQYSRGQDVDAPMRNSAASGILGPRSREGLWPSLAGDDTFLCEPAVLNLNGMAGTAYPRGLKIVGTAAQSVAAVISGAALVKFAYPSVARMAELSLSRAASSPPEPLYLRAADAKPQAGYVPRPFIRAAERHEAAILAALHGECFDKPWDAKAFDALMAMPGASALFALDAGEPVGFVLARAAADEAEIIAIGVRPSHRRKGIARRLLRELNIPPRLFIEVAEGNAAARAFYDSEGFARAGERKGYYARPDGGREDAIVMRRDARP